MHFFVSNSLKNIHKIKLAKNEYQNYWEYIFIQIQFPKMKKIDRSKIIISELQKLYPETPIPLNHDGPYTLLIAVVLSAQSTDKKVNELTEELFKVANTPQKMVNLGIDNIYQ